MKKSNIITLRIIAVLSLLIALLFFVESLGLMFNLFGFKDMYIDILQKMGMITEASEINFQVYMGIFDSLIGLFLNSYCAGTYYKLSKANNIVVGGAKVLLYIGLLQCLFIISIVPGIFAIIISFSLRKSEMQVVNRPRNEHVNELDQMTYQINVLKQQKQRGEITEQQYDRALNDIIENSAKNKIFNPNKDDLTLLNKENNEKGNIENNNKKDKD